MINISAVLVGMRAVCFFSAIFTCYSFTSLFFSCLSHLIERERVSFALQVSAGIWLSALGTALFTGYVTINLILGNIINAGCHYPHYQWTVAFGFGLTALGYFLHCLGKAGADERKMLGLIGVAATIAIGFVFSAIAWKMGVCASPAV